MGELADKLAELAVTGESPDGKISAGVRAGELARVTLRPGAYERYAEAELEHQLARTAALLYIGHERAVRRLMEEAGVRRATEPSQARDESQREFLQALQSVAAVGTGLRELVTFEITGMAHWECRIAAGTLQSLPEPEFIAELTAAAQDLLRKSRYEKALLKNEFFGTRHAPPVRERILRRAGQPR